LEQLELALLLFASSKMKQGDEQSRESTMATKPHDQRRKTDIRGILASLLRRVASWIDHRPPEPGAAKKSGKKAEDEYLMWVRFAVPGMLHRANAEAMEHAIANLPQDKPVLEIGSFCGLSTVILSHLLDKHAPDSTLFTCDKWSFEGQKPGTGLGDSVCLTHDDYRQFVKETFLRNARTFMPHRLPYTIECFSDEFFRSWFAKEASVDVFGRSVELGGEISFCYIDGNHTYEFAKRDFENTDRALVPGGFILFDDSGDGSDWEVNCLTREIADSDRYELISKNPNYLFRKK
jgi:hypothetical protein